MKASFVAFAKVIFGHTFLGIFGLNWARRSAAKLLNATRRIAANIAKSPEPLRRTILNRVGRATPLHIEFANALIT
jgi:hypothetical protein